MTTQRPFLGITTATLAALCWGSATVMSKGALDQVPPIALLVIQLASSLAFLWTLLLVRGVRTGAIRDAFRIAWLGLLEPGIAFVLALIGLAYTKAGIATLIASLGDSLIALGTLVAAVYVVLSSRVIVERDPVLVVACQQLVAGILALALLPIEIVQQHGVALGHLPTSTWALAVGSGIVQYALAFAFYLAAMRSITASLAGTFLYLTPVVGLAGAVIFLDEKFTVLQLVGAAIVLGALLLLSWTSTVAAAGVVSQSG